MYLVMRFLLTEKGQYLSSCLIDTALYFDIHASIKKLHN